MLVAEIAVGSSAGGWIAGSAAPYRAADAVDVPDTLLDRIYELYVRTYRPMSSGRFNIKSAYALLEFDRFIVLRDGSAVVGFILAKTTRSGVKICLTGHDGSKGAKAAIIALHTEVLNVAGVYAEVSGPLERRLADVVPSVPAVVAQAVLGKPLVADPDKVHYSREITNIGMERKKMVGRPRLTRKNENRPPTTRRG